jgi:hypothetical protein
LAAQDIPHHLVGEAEVFSVRTASQMANDGQPAKPD